MIWQGGLPPRPDFGARRGCFFPVRLVVHWVVLALIVVAAAWDLRTREVPDWIPLAILSCAVLATAFGGSEVRWPGLIAGLLLGLACSVAVFYLGGLGGADVKLIAAIGAAVGPWALLSILAWMGVAGGVLALIAAAREKRDFAYVPAIIIGVLVETVWPGGLARVLLR